MRSVQDWLNAYSESHQNLINKRIHWVCVPLIMLSLLGILWTLKLPFMNTSYQYFNCATLLITLASIYYFKLSPFMGIGMIIISSLMILIISYLNNFGVIPYIFIFTLSWIGQFIGHKIEGKKPSFFEDIQFLLIGPLWILAQFYKFIGLKY